MGIDEIKHLVDFFEKNEKQIKANWNETETRLELINPFFEALGWDVNNKKKLADVYKEVKHEASLKIGTNMKAPDYSFNYGKPIFFLEAKKPSVNIKEDISPSFQLRRYGWTAKMPISILTDFEELAIYDCRIKPHKKDNAGVGRVKYYTYKDYIEKWDEIYNFISKEAVLHGSLNDFENKEIKGTASIDNAFLESIEDWRKKIALNIALRNEITENELNFAVQLIIDRIIFLRICEDRGIEPYGVLKEITNGNEIYKKLVAIFERADDRYNSGLFHFKNEKNRDEHPDTITQKLNIDDKVLKEIIKSIYYPDCPYEMSVLSSDMLGSVYERFLGKIITLKDNSSRAVISLKPEVRKAGGVYYTPKYIVDYIIKNTVGELLKAKNPKEVENIKILDPACGSGSFLIATYQYLLDWHLNFYLNNDSEKWSKGKNQTIFESKNGLQLTLKERKKILLNNIHGVDIDKNAVEVTKLSLLLKVLEYEGQEVQQKELFQERILPDLYMNIKCGNSLIGTDIFSQGLSHEELKKVNPFDWNNEFKEIMNTGGFDCVIGNPPYFNIQTLGVGSEIANYIKERYSYIWMDKSDILFYFIAKGIEVSKGFISYIISNAFLFSDKAQKLRSHIINNTKIEKIVNFEQYLVFRDASITTSILTLDKTKKNKITKVINLKEKNYTKDYINQFIANNKNYFKVNLKDNNVFALVDDRITELNNKIDKDNPILRDVFKIGKGMETASNKVFLFKECPPQFPKEFIKKRMSGEIISRYFIDKEKEYLLYFENIESFNDLPESIKNHLKQNKSFLKNRATVKNEGRIWHRYSRPMHKEYYQLNKIWCSYRNKNNAFVYDDTKEYIGLTNTTVIFDTNNKLDLKYLLALLNSKLFNFRYKSIGKQTGSGIFEYFENGVGKLPIKEISQDQQKPFIQLVENMINLQKKYHSTNTDHEKKLYEKQIESIDNQVDKLVYELYGLDEEDIKIIEENFS